MNVLRIFLAGNFLKINVEGSSNEDEKVFAKYKFTYLIRLFK